MTVEQAIETLKNYPCVCKYGTSPIKCTDTECDFGKAIKALTIDVVPTVEPAQKVIVVQPEIIDPVAKAIVDTIYKLDWNTIIKMYRGGACKGEWITDELHNTVCSICGGIRRDNRSNHIDFCNKCGADMR